MLFYNLSPRDTEIGSVDAAWLVIDWIAHCYIAYSMLIWCNDN